LPNKRSHLLETSGLAGANIPTVYALSGKTVVERADTLAQQCYGAAATLPMHIRGAEGEEYGVA
jgi:hypothetical protein